jgi:Tfp pilus assembly protein PilE
VRASRGITLIELIALVAVVALSGAIIADTLSGTAQAYRSLQIRKALERDAWGALERMRREIQRMRSCTLADLLIRDPADLQLRDHSLATVRFRLVGSTLKRNDTALLDGVTQLSFSYLTAASSAAARVGDIRRIAITLTAAREGESITLKTEVEPRSATFPFSGWREP